MRFIKKVVRRIIKNLFYKLFPSESRVLLKLNKLIDSLSLEHLDKLLNNFQILACGYGQYKSFEINFSVDGTGKTLPKFTYPAIDYLKQLNLADKAILEWGTDESTCCWAADKAKEVVSVKNDREIDGISTNLPQNVTILYAEKIEDYVIKLQQLNTKYDVIIINGPYRYDCAEIGLNFLKDGGLVVLNNSESYPNTSQLLREKGFLQVDFFGFGPVKDGTWCTSLFLNREFAFSRRQPFLPSIGGDVKDVIDDIPCFLKFYSIESYSQEGEDSILREIFGNQEIGFYVDIGAHHPVRFSNTFYFYNRGWRGINIEPTVGTKNVFDLYRPRDINLEIGISSEIKEMTFYLFDEPALNTFNEERVSELQRSSGYRLLDTKSVKVDTLVNVLDKYAPDTNIDFMSVDVEGYELDVLQSNNWEKYRPKILLIEILDFKLAEANSNPIHQYLVAQGYQLFAKSVRTVFYKDTVAK